MLTFLTLKIEGFCSIVEEFSLNLNQVGHTILIKAPNGSGKSTIFSALVWVLYGKNLKGISEVNTWKEYQPKDYSGTKVEIFFSNGNSVYKVVRCQKYKKNLDDGAKGNDRLIFMKDGEPVNIKGKGNIQYSINNELGLSYNLFMNSIMFGQGIKRLIQESNSDKKKIFEEVFDLEFLNIAKGIAMQDKHSLISKINDIEHRFNFLKKEIETNKSTYLDLKNQEKTFKSRIKEEREELKEDRKKLTKLLIDTQKQLSDEVELTLPKKVKVQQDLVVSIKTDISFARAKSTVPLGDIVDSTIELLENGKVKKAISNLKELKESFNIILTKSDELLEANGRLLELKESLASYRDLKSKCSDIADDISTVDANLDKLKREKQEILSPKYKLKLRELKKERKQVELELDTHKKNLEDYNWLIEDPLGNNGIKAYLFDSCLDRLNSCLDRYSEVLGFRIEFSIDLSSTRKDFVTLIERDSRIIEYDELSGGEKQLVNIAMAFAMNESLTASKGINIAFLDEVFESLSMDNIEVVISLIKEIFSDKTLFLITHHESLPFSNSKILQVKKSHGISHYTL